MSRLKLSGKSQALKYITETTPELSLNIEDLDPKIIIEPGRPQGFIGEVSSIQNEENSKFACTDDLEDALSSVQPN